MKQYYMKHTKGKWIFNEEKCQITSENECSKNGGIDLIAQCYTGFNYEDTITECKANAKLIAAAPEMLEALILAFDLLNYNVASDIEISKIENIIKKTTT